MARDIISVFVYIDLLMHTVKRTPRRLSPRVCATPRERRMTGQQRVQELREQARKQEEVLMDCAALRSPANDALALQLGYDTQALMRYYTTRRVVDDVMRRQRGYGVSSYEEASREYAGEGFAAFSFSVVPSRGSKKVRRGCTI